MTTDELRGYVSDLEADGEIPYHVYSNLIDAIDTLDVQPVIPAKWIMRGGRLRCSNCDALAPLTKGWEDGCTTYTHTKTKFCSECGAKMFESQESEVDGNVI